VCQSFSRYFYTHQIKEDELVGEKENAYEILIWKREGRADIGDLLIGERIILQHVC
jgi:hypothetical protein